MRVELEEEKIMRVIKRMSDVELDALALSVRECFINEIFTRVVDRIIEKYDLPDSIEVRKAIYNLIIMIKKVRAEFKIEQKINDLSYFYELDEKEREALKVFLKPDEVFNSEYHIWKDDNIHMTCCVDKSRLDSELAKRIWKITESNDHNYYCIDW